MNNYAPLGLYIQGVFFGGPGAHAWAEISIIPQVQLFVKHFLRKSCTNIFSRICATFLKLTIDFWNGLCYNKGAMRETPHAIPHWSVKKS